jgi:hypothetical protein
MNADAHADSLRQTHHDLEEAIKEENQRPKPDASGLSVLKRQKLRIKDEIAELDAPN